MQTKRIAKGGLIVNSTEATEAEAAEVIMADIESIPPRHGYIYFYEIESFIDGIVIFDERRYVRFDHGNAFEYNGFKHINELMGMAHGIFQPETTKELMRHVYNDTTVNNTVIMHLAHIAAIWKGDWTTLEKSGVIVHALNTARFGVIHQDIIKNFRAGYR